MFQKPTLPIKFDALKFLPLTSYWREAVFQGWGFQGLHKICLRMGDRAINNICLIHKIALIWSILRNIFQPMDYAVNFAVQLKKIFFLIFLKYSTIYSGL